MAYQQQDKTPANWIMTQVLDNNVTMKVSDKGAIMLRSTLDDKFIACFQAKQAETIVNASGDMANMILSEEYKALLENKAKNKQERRGNKKKLITFFRVLFRVGRRRKGLIIHRSPRNSLSEYSCELVANYVPGLFTCTPSPTAVKHPKHGQVVRQQPAWR